jgi:hypothetical protein
MKMSWKNAFELEYTLSLLQISQPTQSSENYERMVPLSRVLRVPSFMGPPKIEAK